MAATSVERLDLTPAEATALQAFMERVRVRLGDALVEARLFGSRARGEGNEESDLDIALVVRAIDAVVKQEIQDLSYDIGLEHGVMLAPLVLEEGQLAFLRSRERLLAADLDREGVVL